ncbi:related to dityrosine transporter [Cephalotrichum gorgonifer]|uniref:Related to dityrosine transporter n=1 Tax=Cephalotrichum gorgonifer TaxID=2041049 RepID=A0AAE8SR64_9PEZI|nr:related to dityrosine transporter [Cephalotrichum gorgonifer]
MSGSLDEKSKRPPHEVADPDITDETGEKAVSVPENEPDIDAAPRSEKAVEEEGRKEEDVEAEHDLSEADSHSHHSGQSDEEPISRTSTAQSRALSIVPRSRRRGLFARLAVVPEVDRPYDYKNSTKWIITLVIALAGAAAPFGSSIFYPALTQLTEDLNTTPAITNLSIAMYMLSMSIFPLWWATCSQEFGRRTIYIISFTLFVVFSVLSAVSTSISMLIVMRLLGGGASASVQAVGAGTISDIWEVHERGRAMGFFYLGPLLGPLLAPFIGGALAQGFGWRSTMWLLAAYGGVMVVAIVFVLPETLANRDGPAARAARRLGRTATSASAASSLSVRARDSAAFVRRIVLSPLGVIAMLRFPAVLLTVFWASITFGSLYVLNISLQAGYSNPPYSFSIIVVGVFYIPPSLGYGLSSAFGGRWIDRIMIRQAEKAGRYDESGKLVFLPEDRFAENAWIAGTVYPLALIFYGWTIQKGLHWAVPAVGTFLFGLASMLVFSLSTTALTEFMPGRGAEGVAVNNFVRNIFSCIGAIVAEPIISALGHGWTFTILGLATLVLSLLTVCMVKMFGKRWRKSMDEALSRNVQR